MQTASWERTSNEDDGRSLSWTARALLKLGHEKSGEPAKSDPTTDYSNFFRFFPEARRCGGLVVADVGGGSGELSKLVADSGAEWVYCVEPNPAWAERARALLLSATRARASVICAPCVDLPIQDGEVDRVILHDVMEHVADPLEMLAEVRRILSPSGETLVSFVPWYSPYGGHTWSFLPVPWLHAFYSRKVLAEMRSAQAGWHTTDLGATGLYKVTVSGFLNVVRKAGLSVEWIKPLGLKGHPWLTRWPLREFGTALLAAKLSSNPRPR